LGFREYQRRVDFGAQPCRNKEKYQKAVIITQAREVRKRGQPPTLVGNNR